MRIAPQTVLSILLIAFGVVVLVHLLLESNNPAFGVIFTWHFALALLIGFATVGYAWNLRCPSCRASQVFRGLSITDIRWPGKRCYRCGVKLHQKYVNGKPGAT